MVLVRGKFNSKSTNSVDLQGISLNPDQGIKDFFYLIGVYTYSVHRG